MKAHIAQYAQLIFRYLVIISVISLGISAAALGVQHLLGVSEDGLNRRGYGPVLMALSTSVFFMTLYNISRGKIDECFRSTMVGRIGGVLLGIAAIGLCAYIFYFGFRLLSVDIVDQGSPRQQDSIDSGNQEVPDYVSLIVVGVSLVLLAVSLWCFRQSQKCMKALQSEYPEVSVVVVRQLITYRKGKPTYRVIVRLPSGGLGNVYARGEEGESLKVRQNPWSEDLYCTAGQWKWAGSQGVWRGIAIALLTVAALAILVSLRWIFADA